MTTPTPVINRRRLILLIAAAAVVVILILVAVVVALQSASSTSAEKTVSPTPSALPSRSTSSSATPSPSSAGGISTPEPSIDPSYGAPVADTVPVSGTGAFGESVTVKIASLDFVTAQGTQVGEKSGAAARIDIQFINSGSSSISLDEVGVNVYYGADKTPAAPVSTNSGKAGFSGSLASGKSATGRFLFNVPKDQQDSLIITVAKDATSPIVVFH
ncbi:DUF4352 domain-containing protein [Glaciihabitans sp. UYNi722]|uniref:DUF4352 domain-containing protein n=1 Tax=Glaciihabitans sp. UYNi722 TaxID=3156344 RepID=UPI003391D360